MTDGPSAERSAHSTASFPGGTWRRGSWLGVSGPFGRLTFDDRSILITGLDALLRVQRTDVTCIRLRRGFFATRVLIETRDGPSPDLYFNAYRRRPVRRALLERGWPVDG